jgi:hypothetical protein
MARVSILVLAGAVSDWRMVPNYIVLQRFSRVERVTGIEPALSAWEDFLCHRKLLNRTCIGGLS